ncbi:MAG: serine/threonine-protein kinase, partial [Planctomycetota bacterium]
MKSPERMRRLEELFSRMVELPPEEREAFLDRECEDTEIRSRLAAMLEEELRGHAGILEVPIVDFSAGWTPTRGERLGSFRVERPLGAGGMGTVCLAEDGEGRRVALKVLHPHLVGAPGFFKRFLREAQSGRRVDHPHVVRTLDADAAEVGGSTLLYLVMEYVEGRTLRQLLKDLGPVPEALLLEIAGQAASGLSAIHEAGVVHRDLKPENILITDDHRVRIMDLGVARRLEETLGITREGLFVGSLPYAAPEQFGAGEVGPAADLYALGVVLHELASGVNPFRHDDPPAVMKAQLETVPPRVGDVVPGLSDFLSGLVSALLEKDPNRRPGSAAELRDIVAQGERSPWWSAQGREVPAEQPSRPRIPVRRETELYGRDTELRALRRAWDRAREGEGGMVLVGGEAGIGKTRLVDAFLRELDEGSVLYGSYSPAGGLGGLSDAVLQHFGGPGLEEGLRTHLQETPALVSPFAAVLRHESPVTEGAELTSQALHTVFCHLMRGLASERPLVWVVEDLHFAGLDSRQVVASLTRALAGHRVLLIATTRPGLPEDEVADLTRLGHVRRMALGRLSPREVIQLLRDAFRSERLAEKLGGRIAYKSDGVPFFVFEMIRGLKEGQFVEELPDGTWVETAEIEEIEVPSAVRDLIEARLRDLSPEERNLLDVGSVLGFEFDPSLVAAVLGRERVAALQDLARVQRGSGVVVAAGRRFRFDHHQIQEVIYADIPEGLREEYHTLVAETSAEGIEGKPGGEESVFLASHHLRGRRPEKGIDHLPAAVEHLEKSYRNEEVIDLADRALEFRDLLDGEKRVKILLRKADRHDLRGEPDLVSAALDEAIRLADLVEDPTLRADCRTHLSRSLYTTSDFAAAREAASEALELARRAGDRRLEGRARTFLGNAALPLGNVEEALEHFERRLSITREIGDRQGEGEAMGGLGLALSELGRYAEAREHIEGQLGLARETGDRAGEVNALGNLGVGLLYTGRYEEARSSLERQLALAREIGDRLSEKRATGNLGLVHWYLGRYEDARAHSERDLAIAREIGYREGEAIALTRLGLVYFQLGRHEEAREHHERARDLSREVGHRRGEAAATGNLGLVNLRLGRYEDARECFERSNALAREMHSPRDEAIGTTNLGIVYRALGRYAAAREHFERSLALSRKVGIRPIEVQSTANLGLLSLALGELDAASRTLESALAMFREIGECPGEANALRDLSVIAEIEGDIEAALSLTEKSLALFRKTGEPSGTAATLISLGRLQEARGRQEDSRELLQEAVSLGANDPEAVVLATCRLALLPGGSASRALSVVDEYEQRLEHAKRLEALFLLWRAGRDRDHLLEAKRLLDELVAHAPEECRESMIANVPLHREVVAAWHESESG